MTPKDVFLTAILPALICVCAVLFARAGGASDLLRARRERASLLAAAVAFVVGARFVVGAWPEFPPATSEQWLFYLAVGACLSFLVMSFLTRRAAASLALCLLFGAAVSLLALKRTLTHQFDTPGARAAAGTLAAALIALPMFAASLSAGRTSHAGTALALLAAAAVSAPGMFFSSSVKLAQLAGVLAAIAAVFAGAALVFRRWELSKGSGAVLAGLLSTLWVFAHLFASAPMTAAALGALSPGAGAISLLPGMEKRPRVCMALQCLVAAALAAGAAALAFQVMPKDDDLYG